MGYHGDQIKFAPEVLEAIKTDYLGGASLSSMERKYGHSRETLVRRLGILYKPTKRAYRFMGKPRKEIKGKTYKEILKTQYSKEVIRNKRGEILKIIPKAFKKPNLRYAL